MKFRDSNIYRVCLPRVRHTPASWFVSLLDPLIQRFEHSRVHRGDHIHRRIELFFRHPRFPCVRKAPVHSRIAEPHHCDGEADEHLLALGQTLDRMRIAVKSSEVGFLQGHCSSLCWMSSRNSVWWLATLSESFDWLRTNGDRIEISEKCPFMLSWVEAFLISETWSRT